MSQLRLISSSLSCNNCGNNYKINDDIIDLYQNESKRIGEISQEQLKNILSIARNESSVKSIIYLYDKFPNSAKNEFNSSKRGILFHCLADDYQDNCLIIGSGWGYLSFSLAKSFTTIWSLESVYEKIQFQSIWKRELNANNVYLLRSDLLKLPFEDNIFDVVIVSNNVLDKIGSLTTLSSIDSIQSVLLREINRTLKKSGKLCFSLENGPGIKFFLGAKNNGGFSFTSKLPRVNDSKKDEVKPHKQSCSLLGYFKKLKKTNYKTIKTYWTYPYYYNPSYSGLIDDVDTFRAFYLNHILMAKNKIKSIYKIIFKIFKYIPNGIMKVIFYLFYPSFFIVAYKNHKTINVEDKILEYSGTSKYYAKNRSKKTYFFLDDKNKPYYVAKIWGDDQKIDLLLKELRLQENYGSCSSEIKKINGKLVLFQKYLGLPLDIYNMSHIVKLIDWLINFQRVTSNNNLNQEIFEYEIKELIMFLEQLELNEEKKDNLKNELLELNNIVKNYSIPYVSSHSDLWYKNILIDNHMNLTILDWESFRDKDIPFLDIIFYAITSSVKDNPSSFYDNLVGIGNYSEILYNILITYCRSSEYPLELCIRFVPYTILRYLKRCKPNKYSTPRSSYFLFQKLLDQWIKISLQELLDNISSYTIPNQAE